MDLSEAEIQVLASLAKADIEGGPTDRSSLEANAERFWIFRENWSEAYSSLAAKELIEGDDDGYRLTDPAGPLAQEYHRRRPNMYWYYYQKFYRAARPSKAHSELCRRVFGADLCQEGQTDMASLKDLLDILDLKRGEHLLDLGCGAGVIAEYISDQTGVSVTGLDYSDPAIDDANQRTADKRSRMTFLHGDMNALDLPAESLDTVISLDTLYWVSDMEETLSKLVVALRPGGRMGIFMNHHIAEGDDPARLAPQHTKLSMALSRLGVPFETSDYTVQIGEFWKRNWQAATDLKAVFEAEGNGFIAASLIRESEEDYLPDIKAGRIARYLYHVHI
jgi:ubiquinone/menaquinone biosynthesis C-methylase UbiE